MGASHATEYAGLGTSGLAAHLQSNHYPPVPLSMVPVCVQAIEFAQMDEYDVRVELPAGVSWRGDDTAPVWAIIEGHHLAAWVDNDGDEDDEYDYWADEDLIDDLDDE